MKKGHLSMPLFQSNRYHLIWRVQVITPGVVRDVALPHPFHYLPLSLAYS